MTAVAVHDGGKGTATIAALHCGFDYMGCYCEENVWLLCQQLCNSGRASEDNLRVVFVSNPDQQVFTMCRLIRCRTLPHVTSSSTLVDTASRREQGQVANYVQLLRAGLAVCAASWAWPAWRRVLGLPCLCAAAAQ
jgi:N-terminal glutamine amidase